MDADHAITELVSMLQRKAQRLEHLPAPAEDHGDVGKFLVELRDVLMDVCQLTIRLYMMDRREASKDSQGDVVLLEKTSSGPISDSFTPGPAPDDSYFLGTNDRPTKKIRHARGV